MGQLVREAIVCGLFALGIGLLYALHELGERRQRDTDEAEHAGDVA